MSIKLLSVVLIFCLGLIVYSNTFHASFQFDDRPSITDNYAIKHIQNIQDIWSSWPCRFLTYLSFAVNYRFNQLDVFGYHLFNIMVHLGSALLVWWLVLLTFSTPVMKGNRLSSRADLIALFAGLLFVSHPVQTEAVTYIVQRASSMAAFFYLASLCLYVKARLLQENRADPFKARVFYFAALFMTVLTMFTKEMTITLPLMMVLYEFCFLKTEKSVDWKRLEPFLLTMSIIPLTMVMTKYINFEGMRRNIEGPQGITSLQYLLTQFRVLVTYIRLDFFPFDQNLDYEYPISKSIFELSTFGSFIFLAGILYCAKELFSKYRILSFSIFWFFLTLLPESSIVPIRDVIFEHRLYLALAGYSIFLVSGIFYFLGKRSSVVPLMLLILIIGINSVLTYQRNKVWQDEFSLWNDVIHKSPNKERPVNIRGTLYDAQGQVTQAIADYDKAIQLNPQFAPAYSNRGNAYNKLGNLTQAISDYSKAIEMVPNAAGTYNNRGLAYERLGNVAQAMSDYNKAIQLDPALSVAYSNRAASYTRQGNLTQALSDYNNVVYLNPNNINAYNNLGIIYDSQRNFTQAVLNYTKAIQLDPNIAELYLNRGNANNEQGNLAEALKDYNKAIALKPDYANAYDDLVVTYSQLKDYDNAWGRFHQLENLPGSYDPQRIMALRELLNKSTHP